MVPATFGRSWHAAQVEAVGLLGMGDEMGYKTGTMFSPAFLRTHVFPWQKKLVEVAHAQGKPFVLHSCGNLTEIMWELIHEVRIDGYILLQMQSCQSGRPRLNTAVS